MSILASDLDCIGRRGWRRPWPVWLCITLLVFTQLYKEVIFAWGSQFNVSPISALLPIGENQRVRNHYNQFLDVSIPLFVYGLLPSRPFASSGRDAGWNCGAGRPVGVITILMLMREWPYRTFNHRDFERADFDGARCYLNGESGDEFLVLCPGGEPPRNHVVTARRPSPSPAGHHGKRV